MIDYFDELIYEGVTRKSKFYVLDIFLIDFDLNITNTRVLTGAMLQNLLRILNPFISIYFTKESRTFKVEIPGLYRFIRSIPKLEPTVTIFSRKY